jgi:hypothetical protein
MAKAWWRDSDYELFDRLTRERDEALKELKYLREHMENAGGDNWADAETHEIRSYLRSIVRGCKIKV